MLSSLCATETQQGRRCSAQCSVSVKRGKADPGLGAQSVQPTAMSTGVKDSCASRRHPHMESTTLSQGNAVSPRAPQDTHWPRGAAHTVAASGTGGTTHSDNHSSRLFLSTLGRLTILGLGNTAPASASVSSRRDRTPPPWARAGWGEGWQGRGEPESRE